MKIITKISKVFLMLAVSALLLAVPAFGAYAAEAEPANAAPTEINFSAGESITMGLNETYTLVVKDQNKKTVNTGITYSTSSSAIVSVNKSGTITGKKTGTATITAKAAGGAQASCRITVKNAPTGLTLNITSAKIGVGEKSVDLDSYVSGGGARVRSYSSSNTKVATVNSSGIVTGIGEGTATITCRTYNNKTATCSITVGKAPKNIVITNINNIVQKDTFTHRVRYSLSAGAYSNSIKFEIEDTNIAEVDKDGYVLGKKVGSTNLTITAYNGVSVTQKITVQNNALSLNVKSKQIALDYPNVEHYVYGKSVQGRNLEAYILSPERELNQQCKVNTKGKVNVRSAPGSSNSLVASLAPGTTVTRVEKATKAVNGTTWDKIVLSNGKTGWVVTSFLTLIKDNTPAIKTMFMDFAIHGFEDEYYRDGQVLVNEANALISYFAAHPKELGNARLVIVPCVNPDGTLAGTNNQRACSTAFGRCTANHIDMNRDWNSFKATETVKLRDFIKEMKPSVYLNMHGWYNQVIGTDGLNSLIGSKLGLSQIDSGYGKNNGYAIGWVHDNLKIPAALVEYKSSKSVSKTNDVNMIKAVLSTYCGKNPPPQASAAVTQGSFATAKSWKNGSGAETAYKNSNLTEKTGSLSARETASCYRKIGSGYLVVYNLSGTGKHKAGFVKYAGGVSSAPTAYKTYKNNSSSEAVYADTAKKTRVGSLDPNESCMCLAKIDGMYLVCYKVNGSSNYKCGFVSYNGGC